MLFHQGAKYSHPDKLSQCKLYFLTSGAVKETEVYILFEGSKRKLDFWCFYDDRSIFPLGWCKKSGHPIDGKVEIPGIKHLHYSIYLILLLVVAIDIKL